MSIYHKLRKHSGATVTFDNVSSQETSTSTLSKPYKVLQPEHAVKKKELKRKPSKILSLNETPFKLTSIEQVDSLMKKFVMLIEKTSAPALKQIKTYIHCNCEADVKKAMTLWKNKHNLNLVHYAIIYKRPEIVQYLLAESCVYPTDSQPAICPYAHLAAYLGASASIKVILVHRPLDFFKCRLPSHDIQLPDHVIRRFNLNHPIREQKARFDEVLRSIKDFKKSEYSRHSSFEVQSDDLNELITYLQTVYLDDNIMRRQTILPPINQHEKKKEYKRILRPRTYSQLFKKTETKASDLEITDFYDKTPLTLAAERCYADTVEAILETISSNKYKFHRKSEICGPLLRATKSLSPEAISTLLEFKDISKRDYQDSVLEALRQMLPGCLIALLTTSARLRFKPVFGGMNLFHMLYTQCIDADSDRYQMLPLMTRALVYCKENVNSYTSRQTFPLYSLISSSFNASSTKNLYHIFECLWILFKAGANPYFVEKSKYENLTTEARKSINRPAYTSIFNCIFSNTSTSLESDENIEVPLAIMKNSILFALNMTKNKFVEANKYGMNPIIFEYLEKACSWGLDSQILTKMLSSGVDPNAKIENRYALNAYFDAFFEYVLEFEIHQSHDYYKNEMGILMILCHQMSPECLRQAVKSLLNQYVRGIPVEAVCVTRYFLYLADGLLKPTYFH